ncbi:phosphate acyltransferase PlsX [Dissulfurirhabdus thermomarina]|uniref:Phosphate acyltransferase n=1 Tax=Dissulfurirhabdus thermomarina TaxID=1765737 RepID=A0A6N9TP19_DISTH|nr:phosphate acyltransferase PlsX [Dissulfurirhabdus thermomarina]NDY42180.1 phosphate acyltransferase PlsX [Dissulfurirhabdus thermomarina]NMX22520.1 phosphate acyltransferase PlsX [Dissulfurirhabdus thermomarina]
MAVAVDAMGGDRGPSVLVEGAVAAAREFGIPVVLVGAEDVLAAEVRRHGAGGLPVRIHNATQVVGMDESPADSLRRKKDSSIRVAFDLVRAGEADAVVSAGNSGATLATAMVALGRISGVRPAIATLIPTLKTPSVLIDVGANVDCKPPHLFQFGVMGAVFSREILKKPDPRVGLLSIGEEDTKGNQQVKKAYDLLAASSLNFVGNVEGRDVFGGDVDVVVCDGFVGNICLKLSEGLAESILQMLRTEIGSSVLGRLGYLMARSAFRRFRRRVDYAEYGGAPLLGINGVGLICHGRSGAKAIKNAVRAAHNLVEVRLAQKLAASLDAGGEGLRAAP